MKLNKKHCRNFFLLAEADIQGLLHPAQINLGYFLVWFQSLQLPSAQSESSLASKYHKYVLNYEQNFSHFDPDRPTSRWT
jgi:hypothetical protein